MVNGADPYPSANAPVHGSFRSDTMGGADVHKGGIEVLNINATKSGRVTTRPLNRGKAEWLREILTSPNVWTEVNTQMPLNPDPAFKKIAYRSLTDITSGLNMDGRTPNSFQIQISLPQQGGQALQVLVPMHLHLMVIRW